MTDLDARYGRRPEGERARGRVVGVVASGGVLVAIALVWLFWAQPWTVGEFWKSTGFHVVDDRTTEVTWEITLGEGQQAKCALAVQNDRHAIVGWRVVDVVGRAEPTQQLAEPVRTTELGDTGLAYRCWLP